MNLWVGSDSSRHCIGTSPRRGRGYKEVNTERTMEVADSRKANGLKVLVLIRSGGCYAFFRKSKTNPFAALSFCLAPGESLSEVLPGLVRAVSPARKHLAPCNESTQVDT